jgi:hypothetical protein
MQVKGGQVMSDAPENVPPMPEVLDGVECSMCFQVKREETWADMDWGKTCQQCQNDLGRQEEDLVISGGLAGLVHFIKSAKGETK